MSIAKTSSCFEFLYIEDFLVREMEVKDIHVFLLVGDGSGFGNYNMTFAKAPVQHYLDNGLVVFLC